jgi:hypothetical protein
MKKLIVFLAIALCLCATNKANSQVVGSGTTGSCTWTLTGTAGNYTLTISGNGAMANYSDYGPWYSHRSDIKTLDIQQGVTTIGNWAFYECSGLTSVTIPNSVTTIGTFAFYNCSGLTSVTIGNSVTTIGNGAFGWCIGLTSVTIPNSVTTIENSAFRDCNSLTSITIPNSVTSIGDYAFRNCNSLISIDVDESSTHYSSVDGILFNKLQNTLIQYPGGKTGGYTIPNSVTTIEDWAFAYCTGLTSVTIPNSITSIGNGTFYRCSGLTSVTIPNSVTSIGYDAFYSCIGLTSVTIPNSVTTIGYDAFFACNNLTSIIIPNSVTTIRRQAFDQCRNVKKLTLGSGLVTIERSAFSESPLDTLISLAINPPALENIDSVFHCSYYGDDYGVQNPAIPVHIPCGRIEAYQNAPGWNYFTNYIDDLPLVNISVESSNPAMGTANVIQANTCTDNIAIIGATANTGYRFVQWNDGNTDNPRTITVTEDIVFTAEFESEVGISEIDASAVAVYPNPAVDNITVTLPESVAQAVFTIYEMQGRVLIYKYIGSGDAVSVDGLAAGMYVYNVVTEKGSHKGKIEIKK